MNDGNSRAETLLLQKWSRCRGFTVTIAWLALASFVGLVSGASLAGISIFEVNPTLGAFASIWPVVLILIIRDLSLAVSALSARVLKLQQDLEQSKGGLH